MRAISRAAPFTADGQAHKIVDWIRDGVLTSLTCSRFWAHKTGAVAVPPPRSIFLAGANLDLLELVGAVDRGLLVTRFWYNRTLDPRTILATGLTRDGTFLVEQGKITTFRAALADEDPSAVEAFIAEHRRTGAPAHRRSLALRQSRPVLSLVRARRGSQRLERFAEAARAGLQTCPEIPGVRDLLAAMSDRNIAIHVVSGGEQAEVREALGARGLGIAPLAPTKRGCRSKFGCYVTRMGEPPEYSKYPNNSRGVITLGLCVRALVRYGWLPLTGVLVIAGLLEWASWRTLLAIGVAGALAIAVSPMAYGVVLALDSRRRKMNAEPEDTPPSE